VRQRRSSVVGNFVAEQKTRPRILAENSGFSSEGILAKRFSPMGNKPQSNRELAAHYRDLAAASTDPSLKRAYLVLAEEYAQRARTAPEREPDPQLWTPNQTDPPADL